MLLAQITDSNNDHRSKTLAEEGPPTKDLYKYFQDEIVECKIHQKGQQVAEQLYSFP